MIVQPAAAFAVIHAIESAANKGVAKMQFTRSIVRAHRIWLRLVLATAFAMGSVAGGFSQDVATTIYIVRHAEKKDNSPDSPLAPKGRERAEELAHVLRDAGLTAIFVSKRVRTQQTAAPTAQATAIEPKPHESSEAIVKDILDNHVGGQVLVVGHSDTIDNIAAGLGANGVPELNTGQYDRLFLVHRVGNKAHLHVLRYGELTD